MKTSLILASSSPFRQQILKKLNLPFSSFSPDVDESHLSGESPAELVARLSILKAKAADKKFCDGLVIGSDQVAVHDGKILGKPHTKENAIKQLKSFSGNKVSFLTGLCLYDIATNRHEVIVEPFNVHFKKLTLEQVESYCDAETPYQCAGSFKSEGLGICLFDKLEGSDPNSLIGLPLIKLTELLACFDVDVLLSQKKSI
jgi:MAF protein